MSATGIGMWKFIAGPLRRRRERRELHQKLREQELEAQANSRALLERIASEFCTNSGSTLKDDVLAIRAQLHTMSGGFAHMEQRVRISMELIGLAMMRCAADGDVLDADRTLTYLCGRPTEELKGRNWPVMVEASDRTRVASVFASAVNNRSEARLDFNIEHLSGRLVPVRMVARPRFQGESVVEYLVLIQARPEHAS